MVGRYTVLGKLGEGAMGAVFLAKDPELDRRIALKLLVSRGAHDFRLHDEARALARLQHPNVVAVHDVGRWEGQVYIAMEHVAGTSLDRWLEKHTGWRERVDAFVQAAQGLAAAHRASIVHHDVKPSNIMVGDDGRVRLVDFGIARSSTPDAAHGSAAGTPRYMSPEQRRGDVVPDARTDQFSLCVALYEALYGTHPYADEDATAPLPPPASKLPPATRDAIQRGLAFDREQRFPSMEALIVALVPPPRARRLWISAVAAVAIAAGVGAAFVVGPSKPAGKYEAILAASNLPPEVPVPLAGDPLGVTVHRLSNGLTVHISPNHDRPRIRSILRFNAGAGDGPGISMLAMLMSRHGGEQIGTTDWAKEKPILDRIAKLYEQRKTAKDTAKIDLEIEKASVEAAQYELIDEHNQLNHEIGTSANNALGLRDLTRFEMDFPSNRFEAWAEIEADRFAHPAFRGFRAGVIEALQMDKGNTADFGDRVLDVTTPRMFPDHPAGFDNNNVRKVIATEPYAETVAFFRERYVPNNADLILVGDIDPVTAIPLLERAFADWKPRSLPPRTRPVPREPTGETITIPTAGNRDISYHWAMPVGMADDPVFLVLDQVVRRALGDINPAARTSIYGAYGIGMGGTSIAEAQKQLDDLIARIRAGKFSDESLQAAQNVLDLARVISARDNTVRASQIAGFRTWFTRSIWRDEVPRITKTLTVSRAEVVELANRLLGKPHLTVRAEPGEVKTEPLVLPTLPPAKFATGRSKRAQAIVDREVVEVQPKFVVAGQDYEQRVTPAGTVVVKQDKKALSFALTFRYDVGSGELPFSCDALAARMSGVLNNRWSAGGFQPSTLCNPRLVTVSLNGRDADLPRAIELLTAAFTDPSEADWKQYMEQTRTRISAMAGRTNWIDLYLEQLAMFGDTSPVLARIDLAELQGVKPADAARALTRLRNSPRSVAYYGTRSLDELAALLPAHQPVPVKQEGLKLPAKSPRVYILDTKGLTDTTMISALYGLENPREGVPYLEILGHYESVDEVLPVELRGRFDMRPVYPSSPRDAGQVELRIKTVPANAAKLLDQAISTVFDSKLDPARIASAKKDRAERLRSDWLPRAEVPLRVLAYLAAGDQTDPRAAVLQKLMALEAGELEAFVKQLHDTTNAVVVWGNVKGLDRAALAKHGEIVDLTIPELMAIHRLPEGPKAASPAPPVKKKRAKPAKTSKRRRR